MIYLVLSIVCSAYLVISFMVLDRLKISISQTIVFNYLACALTGMFMNQATPDYVAFSHTPWFYYTLYLGLSFILTFNLMGIITVRQGASVTTVANKLSMVIPVLLSFYLYNDKLTILKVSGILLALAAVVFTSLKEDSGHQLHISSLYLPIVVFVTSGISDSMIKYSQVYHLKSDFEVNSYNITIFTVACAIGALVMIYNLLRGNYKFEYKSIMAGFMLGIPNYFSMFYLVKILQQPGWDSSSIFPINNIGIVSLTTITAFLVFKEHLSRKNWLGLGLALLSIILVSFS